MNFNNESLLAGIDKPFAFRDALMTVSEHSIDCHSHQIIKQVLKDYTNRLPSETL